MTSEYAADLRAEEQACYDDAVSEEWETLGVDRQMKIITDLRKSADSSDNEGAKEAMDKWFKETAGFYEFKTTEELMAWLPGEEAGNGERLEVATSGYDLTIDELLNRFGDREPINWSETYGC